MSEHEHHEHESWKVKLAHAFKGLKEADDARDVKLHRNQEAAQRIILDVFQPVFAQFVVDAKEHGFNSEVKSLSNGRYKLQLHCQPASEIEFWVDATPDVVSVLAQLNYTCPTVIPKINNSEHFQKSDLTQYLVAQLEAITPNKS